MASKTGGCLCGSVRYELTETPEAYAAAAEQESGRSSPLTPRRKQVSPNES